MHLPHSMHSLCIQWVQERPSIDLPAVKGGAKNVIIFTTVTFFSNLPTGEMAPNSTAIQVRVHVQSCNVCQASCTCTLYHDQVEEDRLALIDRHNHELLSRMHHIMHTTGRVDQHCQTTCILPYTLAGQSSMQHMHIRAKHKQFI